MTRSRSMYRRALAIAGSVAIGLVGAVALASPASAHHSEVSGSPYCDAETGEWVVTWKVISVAPRHITNYQLMAVQFTPEDSEVNGITATSGDHYPHSTGSPLIGEQRLPGDAESASLGVRAKWSNGYRESRLRWGQLTFDGTCEQEKKPTPVSVHYAANCDEVLVTVENPADGSAAEVRITTSNGFEETSELLPGAHFVSSLTASEGLTFQVTVDGDPAAEGSWENPGDCVEVEIPVGSRSDCDTLTIEVTNPFDDLSIEATITVGTLTEQLSLAPLAIAEASFDAAPGTVATVTIGDDSQDISWEEPADCDDPAVPGEGGGLPVTGAQTGTAIGISLMLLTLGGGLFWLARRRRVTFTA